MREWFKGLELIEYGILIVGFLFLQDYLLAKYTFNMDVGVFVENFVFHLQGWNFLAYMVFIPLFQILSIFYLIHFIQHKNFFPNQQSCSNRNFVKIIISILLSTVIVLIDPIMETLKDSLPPYLNNLYYVSLFLIASFSLLMRIYRSSDIKKSIVAIYIVALFCLSVYLIGLNKTFYNFLLWSFITGYFYGMYPQENRNFLTELGSIIKNNLLVVLIFLSAYTSYVNNEMWVNRFLDNHKTNRHETIGMLNKEFLIENESNITINGDFDSLDTRDKVLKIIPATDKEYKVYYLPISSEMRWYFIDRQPNKKDSNITIYGVEEKTSTTDPLIKVRNVTFSSHFELLKK